MNKIPGPVNFDDIKENVNFDVIKENDGYINNAPRVEK